MDHMNLPRYKFSKHSEPELLEFLKVVAEQKDSLIQSKNLEMWRQFLPVDELISEKLKPICKDEIIEIDGDSDIVMADEVKMCHTNDEPPEETQQNHESEDYIILLQEFLETEEQLPEDIIKQFGSRCIDSRQQGMHLKLVNINSECIYNLWKSITAATCIEQRHAALYFIDHILIEKIITINDKMVRNLLAKVLTTHLNEATAVVVNKILEPSHKDFKILIQNLRSLQDSHKIRLLSQFTYKCTNLELHHLGIVSALLLPNTELEVVIKLVELMYNVAIDYAREKTFGKLLLDVMQILGCNVIQHEEKISYLINSNESVFKVKAAKVFEMYLQNV